METGMTKQNRKENAEINVRALERILAKPLSGKERSYFENLLAVADHKLQRAKFALLSPRQKKIDRLMIKMKDESGRTVEPPYKNIP